MTSKSVIVSDPRILLGQPVFAGTRLTVDSVLEQLARGVTVDELLAKYPELSPDAIRAALQFAAETIRATAAVLAEPLDLHGPRPTMVDEKPAIAVRAFVPEAERVEVVRAAAPATPATETRPEPDLPPAPIQAPAQPLLPETTQAAPAAPPAPAPSARPAGRPPAHVSPPSAVTMDLIHPAGVFEAVFPGETEFFPYQLSISLPGGESRLVEDPYRFPPQLEASDLRMFAEARDYELYRKLGAHPRRYEGVEGIFFAVWAPNAETVSVVGDFNRWDMRCHPLRARGDAGLWELFIPGLKPGAVYKYAIRSQRDGYQVLKADPYGFAAELRPATASVVYDLSRYAWHDAEWLAGRRQRQSPEAPLAIYEVHLGSWRRAPTAEDPHGPGRWLTYRELADSLIPYVQGYTHLELMPVAEHPFDGSWGYQITGYFAPTARYGTPDDFRYFVDRAHQAGVGVILDWVPGHFPKDEHGLGYFDGTPLYEPADWRRSQHRDWGTLAFNFERPEVRAYLLSNALFWLNEYHIDGLRVDAVSSMLYLDYSRREGEWLPNKFGGRENLEAIAFLRQFNDLVHQRYPGVLTFAEEATAWPKVTGLTGEGGLGFDLKWNMGWMHDTLDYAQKDPLYRRYHHHTLTFSLTYAFSEHYALPFSHDEVVYGKRALLNKMPGDYPQKFANLRAVYGYMYGHPGKKLVFMGSEFGQWDEWNHDKGLDWMLLDHPAHQQLLAYGRALNALYLTQPALHEMDGDWNGFQWLDCDDADRSTLSFLRRAHDPGDCVAVVVNFTPVAREGYRVGVPSGGLYRVLLNSDEAAYGGSSPFAGGPFAAKAQPLQGQPYAITLTLPPLAAVFLKKQ
jgi:1,4-alpha-glucan branching enzyme